MLKVLQKNLKNKFTNELISEVTHEKVNIGGAISASAIDSSSETVVYLTGPKTLEGKEKSRKNSYKHGARSFEVRRL